MTIAATLAAETAASHLWDVVIVGAGPAGALAAHELARWGCSVLLVDRSSFPRWKVCGSCLNGWALAVLQAAGLGSKIARLGGVPLHNACLAARGRQARIPLPEGLALSRLTFDAALIEEAVKAGAAFLPQTQAALGSIRTQDRGVVLQANDRAVEVHARLVLAADGLGGNLLRGASVAADPRQASLVDSGSRIGAGVLVADGPACYGVGTIYLACGRDGYVGLVRVEDGRLDIASALDPEGVKAGGPGAAAVAVLREAGLPPVPGLADAAWRGTPPLTRRAARLADQRLFVLGDAAGYVEPFTGEGMAWALSSARALVPVAVRGVRRWHPALAEEWAAVYGRTVARRQRACRTLAGVLRHPLLTGVLIGLLSCVPALAGPVVRRLNQSLPHLTGVGP